MAEPRIRVSAILRWRGSLLLCRHEKGGRGYWLLPGGGVKKSESFAVALAREVREEIGLEDVRLERVLGVYRSAAEGKDDHVVVFVVRTAEPTAAIRAADALEIEAAGWFALDALPEDISPASARRIGEYRRGEVGVGDW